MTQKLINVLTSITCITILYIGQACIAKDDIDSEWVNQRQLLVNHLSEIGITDQRVLDAMNSVPRHEFVPKQWRLFSYEDNPLPIGNQQTISQPFIVAYMCQEAKLKPTDKVLEIGTGSGYHAAVMSLLCREVKTIEIIADLGMNARELLKSLDYTNIEVKIGDGYVGWIEEAPFDMIILTAAPAEIPEPLKEQLRVGGRLIAPVGEKYQNLVMYEKTETGLTSRKLIPVRFVPMTGKALESK